jgi:hypothetical protein
MQMKCGLQNGKKFVDDLSDNQFLKEKVALRKKEIVQQITTAVTQIKVTLVLKQRSNIKVQCKEVKNTTSLLSEVMLLIEQHVSAYSEAIIRFNKCSL